MEVLHVPEGLPSTQFTSVSMSQNLSLVLLIRDLYCVLMQHIVDHSCQLLAWSSWLRLPPRITALCSYWPNAIRADRAARCGEERGFQALIRMERWVVWMLYLDVQSLMILQGGQKAVVVMAPASHPTTLSLLVRDLFQDAIRHCFLSCFSLHTSFLICFLGSGEISGGWEDRAKREPGQGHLCASEAAVLRILRVGLFGQDFFQKRSQIPPWGCALCTDALQMGRGRAPLQLGDGDLPLMGPLEPESCSFGKGGGQSSVLGQAGF